MANMNREGQYGYSVIPQSKGDFEFGDLYVRYEWHVRPDFAFDEGAVCSFSQSLPNLVEIGEIRPAQARKGRPACR